MTSLAAMTTAGLHQIAGGQFFRIFDENDLAFLHDPESGSRFSRIVEKESPRS